MTENNYLERIWKEAVVKHVSDTIPARAEKPLRDISQHVRRQRRESDVILAECEAYIAATAPVRSVYR